jgi:hypothetical protein
LDVGNWFGVQLDHNAIVLVNGAWLFVPLSPKSSDAK